MKYAIIIPDGCADEPQASQDGQTPLQAASLPTMDEIAAAGVVGRANHVPAHLPAGSAVANMSLLGYDPVQHFTGRAPLEAAAQGIDFHHPSRSSAALEEFHALIREHSPRLEADRSLKPDVDKITALIESGRFYAATSGILPSG